MRLVRCIKERGIAGTIRYAVLKLLDMQKMQEEIDTLYYFLNHYIDITKTTSVEDSDMRNMQLGMLELMKIFDKICKKYSLTYFLAGGNCLGAVRHKGFIPWDDDVDVAMPREDYNKILDLLNDELGKYGITARWGGYFDNRGKIERLALEYNALETGIWMDIFPCDIYNTCGNLETVKKDLHKATQKYIRYYKKNINKDINEIEEKKKQIYGKYETLQNGKDIVVVGSVEFTRKENALDGTIIFPIKHILYENYSFPVVNNTDEYLKMSYGEDYMKFPRGGVEHHAEPDGNLAKTRAKRNNINMTEVISYLKGIYNEIN